MCPAKKKPKSNKKKNLQYGAAPAVVRGIAHGDGQLSWEQRLDFCTGWLACLIIIVSPLVFNARISNFADLPQRAFIQAAVALFCVLGLVRAAAQRRLAVPRDVCSCALAAFVCWAFASALWSTNSYDALYAAVHWSACALAALGLVAWMHSDVWLGRFAGSMVVSGALVTGISLVQLSGGLRGIPSVKVPSAVFANPNVLGEFLCMTILFSASAACLLRRRPVGAALCWIAVAAGLVVLYLTHCRAAWLAIGCATLWSAGLLLKRRTGWKVFTPVAALILCACFAAGLVLMKQPVVKRSLDGSAHYRLIVWDNALELLKQRSVTGYGAGSFASMYGSVVNTWQTDPAFGKDVQIRRAHNDFVQTAVELGLPGAALLLFFFAGVLVLALRLMHAQRTAFEEFLLYAGSGALVAFLVTACFGFPFQRAVTPLLAFASAGMILALYCREKKLLYIFSREKILIAAACFFALAGLVALRFNLGTIESDGYYKRAVALEKRGSNVRALEFALKARDASPARMDVLTTVGRAYVTTGRLEEGIDALETVTARQPYNLNALFILGAGYANAGRSAEALEAFRRVLEIKPDFEEARRIVNRLKFQGRVKVNFT